LPGPDFCLIFAPYGYDEPEILPSESPSSVSWVLTANNAPEMNMKTRPLAAAIFLMSVITSNAQCTALQRFVIPQSGVAVDVPTEVFSKEVGGLEPAFGQRRTRADSRANSTIQAFPNAANLSPAAFLAS
jgi:hypothetical protein